MIKKITAIFALVLAGLFIAPVAANAFYAPDGSVTVSGTITPGGTSTVAFTAGSFQPGETVSFTLTGENASGATLTVTAAGAGGSGDNDNDLADTGFGAPAFVVWGAAGAVALGAALIAVLVMVRRQRASLAA